MSATNEDYINRKIGITNHEARTRFFEMRKLDGLSAHSQRQKSLNGATRAVASTLGVLVGLAGVEHGFFELLQGNVAPSDIMIDAIGPAQRFWEYGTERALTVIPNFFVTGILAIVFGLLVTIWAGWFIDRKYGAWLLLLLSLIVWLVGGGFAPIFMSILAFVTATRINKPLTWWRAHLRIKARSFLATLWPWSIISFVIVFVVGVEIAIFGYPLLWVFDAEVTFTIQNILAFIMVALMPVSILTAFAYDIHQRTAG
jgi:MFS family permease